MRTLVLLAFACASSASAAQITYSLDLGTGTQNGNPLTSVAILETDGTQVNVDFPFTIPHAGPQSLTHTVAFQPTLSLIVGLDLATPLPGDGKAHVFFFTNSAFANAANGVLFSTVFPNTRHSEFITRFTAAQAGDTVQQAWLRTFFMTGDGAAARFATGGPSTAIEFTTGVIPATPEPSTYVLLLSGIAVAVWRRPRRR